MHLIRTAFGRNITFFPIVMIFLVSSCGERYDLSLGNNLSLLKGDGKEDWAIIYSEGKSNGGIYVIPSYNQHYDSSGRYAEYVKKAISNEEWVIAKTFLIKEKRENYWILNKKYNIENRDCEKLNCDSILQSKIIGPLNYHQFNKKNRVLKTNLTFDQ